MASQQQDALLSINEFQCLEIENRLVGDDRTPVMIIDNVFRDPHRVRNFALSLHYDRPLPGDYWPGIQAAASLDRREIDKFIREKFIREHLGIDITQYEFPAVRRGEVPDEWSSWFIQTRFGIVTSSPGEAPWVNQAHVDEFGLVASIIYLTEPKFCNGGTVLCKHRATGIEIVPPPVGGLPNSIRNYILSSLSYQEIRAILERNADGETGCLERSNKQKKDALLTSKQHEVILERLTQARKPATKFLTEHTEDWKIIDQIDMKFNRMVVYPTWQLHGLNWDSFAAGTKKAEQRLTMMNWVNYPQQRHK